MQIGPKGWGLRLGSGFHPGGSVGTHFHLQGVGIGGRTGRDLGSNTFLEQLSALLVEAVKPTPDEVEPASDVELLLQLAHLIAEDNLASAAVAKKLGAMPGRKAEVLGTEVVVWESRL